MLVKEIGEFGLIERISRLLPAAPADVITGIGDDVAVLKTSGSEYLLATCDTQIEGVHFIRDAITPFQLGRKAVAINISDIAAMGGEPRWALVSLAVPGDTDSEYIEELYRGMREQMALAGAAIVGGNMSRIDSGLVIDLTLLGEIAPEHLVLRSRAESGDAVLVTGFPGESRAGLELVRRPRLKVGVETRRRVLERHFTPQPRLSQGRILARSGLVHAMIDVSDGLLADLGHICEAGSKGAVIEVEALPVSSAASKTAAIAGADVLDWILTGGEDYELLFTAGAQDVPELKKMMNETGIPCTRIGYITGESGSVRVRPVEGKERALPSGRGWDHFAG